MLVQIVHGHYLPLSLCYIFFLGRLYQFGGYILVLYLGVSLTKVISYIAIVNILKCIFLTLWVWKKNLIPFIIKSFALFVWAFFISISHICCSYWIRAHPFKTMQNYHVVLHASIWDFLFWREGGSRTTLTAPVSGCLQAQADSVSSGITQSQC